jgi:hypothetical protein
MNSDFNHQTARLRLDERNHVEKPFLDQLAGLSWEILDLDNKQHPDDTFRETFTEVVMLPVLREQLKVINDCLENDQVEEVVKQLTASFPGTGLIENNRHVLNLLLENTSISENRKTGDKSPTVHFIDFKHPSKPYNSLIANAFFRAGLIESWGRGIEKMQAECKEAGVPAPTFNYDMSGLMIEFRSKDVTSLPKSSGKTAVQIIRLMGENSHITIPELAEALGVTTRAIEKQISNLQKNGQLKRVGPAKGGHREITIKENG